MKYTRYDYKKKKNDSLILLIVLVSVLIVAFLLGTGIMTMLQKQSNGNQQTTAPKSTNTEAPSETTLIKLVAIQNGVYGNKAYAEELKNKLKEVVVPFTIVDGDKVRIMTGIFSEEESNKVIQLLNEKQIPNTKVTFEISKTDLCDTEIGEIIKGYIKILNKLMEKNVAAVPTDDFKKWMASLQPIDSKSKNYAVLEELKKYMDGLPTEVGKEKVEENYIFLYNTLKKITGK